MAVEHGKIGALVADYPGYRGVLDGAVLPRCPAGGAYTLNAVNAAPTCSIPATRFLIKPKRRSFCSRDCPGRTAGHAR